MGTAAAYYIDRHPMVDAVVKHAGMGFAIAYLYNGQMHDYILDLIVRLKTDPPVHVILETKEYDPREVVKSAAAQRCVDTVNTEGSYGQWRYAIAKETSDLPEIVAKVFDSVTAEPARR